MRKPISMVVGASIFALVGCGTKGANVNGITDKPGVPATMTVEEAGSATYHYAFSGQLLSSLGGVIQNFTVQAITPAASSTGTTSSASPDGTIINALGSANGIFHISQPSTSSASSAI